MFARVGPGAQPRIDHLLPQAMSFRFLKSFDEHCRNFVLPAELLDIQPLVDSYRAFLGYEKDIAAFEAKQRQEMSWL